MRERVLITGGAGFIGSHTADELARRGFRIRILDNLARPVHDGRWPAYVRGKGYELVRGDVRRKRDLRSALAGVSYVFHLAAYQDQRPDFGTFFETNTVSTARLFELAVAEKLPIRKIIVASSQFVYGDGRYRCRHRGGAAFAPPLRTLAQLEAARWDIVCPHGMAAAPVPFAETDAPNPTNSYGMSKIAAEEAALRLGRTYGIPATILRYSIVQGARQSPRNLYSGALRIFALQALGGRPLTVYEDGMQRRDFVNVKDVVAANILALRDKRTDYGVYNIGGGKGYRVLDFARLMRKISRSSSPVEIGGFRRTDTRHAVSDISAMRKLGWRPRHGPERSVREYLAWLKASGGMKAGARHGRKFF